MSDQRPPAPRRKPIYGSTKNLASKKFIETTRAHSYNLDRANETCVNEADIDSEFVQSILAADASVFDCDFNYGSDDE